MVLCKKPYIFDDLNSLQKGHILSLGPARFQRFQPWYYLSTDCQFVYYTPRCPSKTFFLLCKLEVMNSHLSNFSLFDHHLIPNVRLMLPFCDGQSKVYQVCFNYLEQNQIIRCIFSFIFEKIYSEFFLLFQNNRPSLHNLHIQIKFEILRRFAV